MTPGEAISLVSVLLRDPTSWLHASVAEWKHPASHEFLALADLFDAFALVNFKKPKPYRRPMPEKQSTTERFGEPIRSEDLPDVLRAFGREVPEGLLSH